MWTSSGVIGVTPSTNTERITRSLSVALMEQCVFSRMDHPLVSRPNLVRGHSRRITEERDSLKMRFNPMILQRGSKEHSKLCSQYRLSLVKIRLKIEKKDRETSGSSSRVSAPSSSSSSSASSERESVRPSNGAFQITGELKQ